MFFLIIMCFPVQLHYQGKERWQMENMTINNIFNKKQLAYICYNLSKTENKFLHYRLKLIPENEVCNDPKTESKIISMFDGLSDSEKEELEQYDYKFMTDLIDESILENSYQDNISPDHSYNPFLQCVGKEHKKYFCGEYDCLI